jgi:hypothetical protein
MTAVIGIQLDLADEDAQLLEFDQMLVQVGARLDPDDLDA